MRGKGGLAGALALVLIAVTAAPSQAAATRAEYVAQVDPICQRTQADINTILNKATRAARKVKDPQARVRLAGRAQGRIAKVDGAAIGEIEKVIPPVSDQQTIAQWLDNIRLERSLTKKLATALIHLRRKQIASISSRAFREDRESDEIIQPLGFTFCDAKPLLP